MARLGRYRFDFEFPGIGWQSVGRYNTDRLEDADRAANDIIAARMLEGRPLRATSIRIVNTKSGKVVSVFPVTERVA